MKNVFVFVVCGTKDHIHTLHYALKAIKTRTDNDIIVVTDPVRNEIPVIHKNVVEIKTPGILNNHEASIWLKTSLHHSLPKGNLYAYLDTDVIAVGEHIDDIFNQYVSPIRFAYDHCTMPVFSPYAVNCNCQNDYSVFIGKLNEYLDEIDPPRSSVDPEILSKRNKLINILETNKKNKPKRIFNSIPYLLSWPKYRLNKEFLFDRKRKMWIDQKGNDIMADIRWVDVATYMGLKYNPFTFEITFYNGQSIWINECQHLKEYIFEKFNIIINNTNWRHRNGGVFLFSDESHAFLETWHNYTNEIFIDPKWKTRDQGTLIATYWKYSLQYQIPLESKWNFICDYNNHLLNYNEENNTITDNARDYIKPEFLHIYHHFGDTSWGVWNWADKLAMFK